MSNIYAIFSRQILDSRANPTLEVSIVLDDGSTGQASVPSGASIGKYEAVELRDEDEDVYLGKGVLKAKANVDEIIAPQIMGMDAIDQRSIDRALKEIDGTPNKAVLGANATLAVSLAVARSAAVSLGLNLYQYLGGVNGYLLPLPQMNIINGGAHADNNVDIQEFMVLPLGFNSFHTALRAGVEVYHHLKKVLKGKKLSTAVGDEGGFAPDLDSNQKALDVIIGAIKKAGYKPGEQIALGIDAAASEFRKKGKYQLSGEGKTLDSKKLVALYSSWVDNCYVVSIEDGMAEDDREGWKLLTDELGEKVQLVGDDLLVTNTERIREAIKEGICNSVLIKLNQIGTLTETLEAVDVARRAGYTCVLSHRSGETEDSFIADLAVALNLGQIKTGAPARSERACKYNQLLRIEEELGENARYAGSSALNPRR